MELAPVSGKSQRGSNPGEYGFVYSADRPKPPPEAGWTDKQGDDQKISLYSENVLKEGDTTESIDRESIANLNTTKKQWEDIFTSHSSSQGDTPIKKKIAPKWDVKVPYTEKQAGTSSNTTDHINSDITNSETSHRDSEDPEMFKKHHDTESAIEREIRLAHEREDILRKDKEDRLKLTEKQKGQGQAIIASYEAESESSHQVYNELAEADRGSDPWSGEHGRRHAGVDDDSDENNENPYPNESIIEKDIRLQRERETEVSKMRQKVVTGSHQLQQQPQEKQHLTPVIHEAQHENKDVNHNKPMVVSYEDAIAKNSHEGESMIAKELRELKEREEELKRLRGSLFGSNNTDKVDGSTSASLSSQKTKATPDNSQRASQVEASSGQGIWNRDSSSHQRRTSLESTSSLSSGRTTSDHTPLRRDVRVCPIADNRSDDEDKTSDYFEKQETPIEREMRLTRARENDLRRQKGLPDIDNKDENPYGSYGASPVSNNSTAVSRPRSVGQPSESMKKFATSRLQQEILKQNERESELRSQGKVISTSEDHIELKKYLEIAGVDRVDGTEKRNFVTKKTSTSNNESLSQQEGGPSGGTITTRKITAVAAGGNMFSYKEFKQTAESKIEKELRELREREEELRLQRTNCQP